MSAARRRAESAAARAAEPLAETAVRPIGETAASPIRETAADAVAETGAFAQGQEWHGGRFMIRQEPNAPGHARLIGSLTVDAVHVLLEAVSSGVCVLDLSEVNQVDHTGVRALARLWLERCTLVGCPRWLELWLSSSRRNGG
jgi:ABC-type transporter Mla MlaB component